MSLFDNQGNRRVYSTGFKVCETCSSAGFLKEKNSTFPYQYIRCATCKGVGQIYLEPVPEKTK